MSLLEVCSTPWRLGIGFTSCK